MRYRMARKAPTPRPSIMPQPESESAPEAGGQRAVSRAYFRRATSFPAQTPPGRKNLPRTPPPLPEDGGGVGWGGGPSCPPPQLNVRAPGSAHAHYLATLLLISAFN